MMKSDASQLCQLLITTPLSQRNHQPFTTTPLESSVTAQGIDGKSALWLKLNAGPAGAAYRANDLKSWLLLGILLSASSLVW